MLIALGKELGATERPPTELLVALAACMAPQHFDDIVALVANGTLLAWFHHEFDVERLAPAIAAVMRDEESGLAELLDACRHTHSPLADALAGKVLAYIKGSEQACRSYLMDALDAGRATHSQTPAFRIICNMFRLEVPINDSQFEISPQADNILRAQLYARAAHVSPVAEGCRRLLAWLECNRREDGRPADEFRHPAADDGAAWTNIFRTLPSDLT